jgi:hypothetical protein
VQGYVLDAEQQCLDTTAVERMQRKHMFDFEVTAPAGSRRQQPAQPSKQNQQQQQQKPIKAFFCRCQRLP